jgi:4-diphosphocytidyl-2-C-methyl-D-erythritol kinase
MRHFLLSSTILSLAVLAANGFVGPAHPGIKTSTTTFLGSAIADVENSSASTEKETLVLFSPCKINLFLRIIRKREDGFHDLASLFQAIGFGDTLELTPLEAGVDKDEFTCNMEGVPTDSSNLVIRALELMREKTGVSKYFKTNLIKQVPAQAGLGGGSANAATAMWGANELMGNPASLEEVSQSFSSIFAIFLGSCVLYSRIYSRNVDD